MSVENNPYSEMDTDREQISNNRAIDDGYTDKIKIDNNLQLSASIEQVKNIIRSCVKYFRNIEDKLKCNSPVFPSDYELAYMSATSYNDVNNHNDLLIGWILLTQASNTERTNGYYGCAYFNAKHQQIVIAHRGTDSLKAVWNDLKGVVFTKFVSQMNSAITFTYKILKLIKKLNQKGAYLKVSLTGHSLGGWLAQVTTFTAKYLIIDKDINNRFTLINEPQLGYHAHTVVFESPGCKQMLENLRTEYIKYRYGDENVIKISIDSLDITTYFSAPNRINCCNAHVGKLYRIFVDLCNQKSEENGNNSWLGTKLMRRAVDLLNWAREQLLQSFDTHSISKIVSCFDPQTGQVKRSGQGKLEVQKVLNWPIIEGIVIAGSEYTRLFEWASKFKDFNLSSSQVIHFYDVNREIRYQTKDFDEKIIDWSFFNEKEFIFLHGVDYRRFIPAFESVLFTVDTDDNKLALQSAIQVLDSMKFQIGIDRDILLLDPKVKPMDFVSFVKQFNHFYSHLNRVERSTKGYAIDIFTEIYKTESLEYLNPIRENLLEFDVVSFNLIPFLINENTQVLLHIEDETAVGVLKIYKIFESVKMGTKYDNGNSVFLDMKTMLKFRLNFPSIFGQIKEDYLIVIENNDNSSKAAECLKEIFAQVESNCKFKVILIVTREKEADWTEIVGDFEQSHHEGIQLSDLNSDTRKQILNRELINLQGSRVSLAQIIPKVETLKSVKDLFQLASVVNCKLDVGRDYLRNSRFDVFAVSNISLEDFQTKFLPGQQVSSYVGWDPNKVRFVVLDADNQFEEIVWRFSHKFRIHWLRLEEDQLILKESRSNFHGNNDWFIERLFTEKFETQVKEVFSGCFVLRDAGDFNEFLEFLYNEEFLTLVEQKFMYCVEKHEVSDIMSTEKLTKVMNKVLRRYFVKENKNNDCKRELLKILLSEKLETLVHTVLSSCFEKWLKGHCKHTQSIFIERFRTQVHNLLSSYFLIGEGDIFISSSGKHLLKSLISTEVLVRLGSKEEIMAGSDLPKLGETEHHYIGRSLTTTGKIIYWETLLNNKDDVFAIANTDVKEFLLDLNAGRIKLVTIWDSDLVMHFEEWICGQNVGKIKYIVLDAMKTANQFKSICDICPNKNIHLLVRNIHSHSSECYYHTMADIDFYDYFDYVYCNIDDDALVPYKFIHKKSRVCLSEEDVLGVDGDVVYQEYTEILGKENRFSIDDIRDSVVTVKGMPGMGKSIFFSHLALHKKKLFPSQWVVVIKLNHISWESLPEIKTHINNTVIKFLAKILKLKSDFEKSLFEYCLNDEKVVLILDAFDEVSPKYDNQIFGLLDILQNKMKLRQLWLSTRPYALKDQRLNKAVYTLRGFTKNDQRKFFLKFWTEQLGISLNKDRCGMFSRELITVLPINYYSSRSSSIAEFPLILMLIAKLYQEDFMKFHNDESIELNSIRLRKFDIHNLYKESIHKIIQTNYHAKCDFELAIQRTQASDNVKNKYLNQTMEKYKLLALVSCNLNSVMTANHINTFEELVKGIDNGEEFEGIISSVVNGVPQFIHKTFAEYFATFWLIEEMIAAEDNEIFRELCDGLFNLLKREHLVVLSLLNSHLRNNHILIEKLTSYLQDNKDQYQLLSGIRDNGYHNVVKLIVDSGIGQNTTEIYKKCQKLLEPEVEMENTDRVEEICLDIYGDACDFTKIIIENHLLYTAAKKNASGKMTSFLLSKVTKESFHSVVNDIGLEYPYIGTALHVAAEFNRLEVAKVLLENGADVGLRNIDGYTALDVAVQYINREMVELLLYNWVIRSPLDLVRSCECIEDDNVAEIFIKYVDKCFMQCGAADSTNKSLITLIACCGYKSIGRARSHHPVMNFSNVTNCQVKEKPIIALIENIAREYPNYLSQLFRSEIFKGETLLQMAARLGFKVTAQLIIDLGADVDIRNNDGETALSVAAKHKRLAFVLWILFRKVEVINVVENFFNLKSEEQTTDLFVEIIVKNFSLSDVLNKRFDGGDTLLHVAARLNHVKLAFIIIDIGADVNVRNDDNHTPLSLACKYRNLFVAKLLIKKGASVNDDQQSPLLWAINSYTYSGEIVVILIENGADVDAKWPFAQTDNKCISSWTPLQLIVDMTGLYMKNYEDLAQILIINGADLSTCLENFKFHFNINNSHLIILFVMCGLDINATNNKGVSLATYLEECWQSMDECDQIILRSVCLFSNYILPSRERNVNAEFENALKFDKYMKDEFPEFYKLINACKAKDLRKIQHHLHNLVSANKFDYDESYDDYIINGCREFLELSISLLIKNYDMTPIGESFFDRLKWLSEICNEYLAKLES